MQPPPLVIVTQKQLEKTFIIEGIGVIRPQRDRPVVFDRGFGVAVAFFQDIAAVVVGFSIIGLEGNRLIVSGQGLVMTVELLQDISPAEVGIRVVGL